MTENGPPMTLRNRVEFWHAQAELVDMRPVWWRRAIIRLLLGIRYDPSRKIYPRDMDAT
jgi:hypothetical protein